jgi:hypothetical protein
LVGRRTGGTECRALDHDRRLGRAKGAPVAGTVSRRASPPRALPGLFRNPAFAATLVAKFGLHPPQEEEERMHERETDG